MEERYLVHIGKWVVRLLRAYKTHPDFLQSEVENLEPRFVSGITSVFEWRDLVNLTFGLYVYCCFGEYVTTHPGSQDLLLGLIPILSTNNDQAVQLLQTCETYVDLFRREIDRCFSLNQGYKNILPVVLQHKEVLIRMLDGQHAYDNTTLLEHLQSLSTCPICLASLSATAMSQSMECGHIFCRSCLVSWFSSSRYDPSTSLANDERLHTGSQRNPEVQAIPPSCPLCRVCIRRPAGPAIAVGRVAGIINVLYTLFETRDECEDRISDSFCSGGDSDELKQAADACMFIRSLRQFPSGLGAPGPETLAMLHQAIYHVRSGYTSVKEFADSIVLMVKEMKVEAKMIIDLEWRLSTPFLRSKTAAGIILSYIMCAICAEPAHGCKVFACGRIICKSCSVKCKRCPFEHSTQEDDVRPTDVFVLSDIVDFLTTEDSPSTDPHKQLSDMASTWECKSMRE
ncbi:hypothetical protein CVT26_006716 [Gymnopilus dilepis]|uniref:RING-type domain-containing protein n=1 Tax=Gymnopilus dilepis TaxID=231916 RepID=A0A409W0R5_9AGAR|nr:hypothetical protein CVT26_006716 [Gymnopilus dilepis]